MFCFFWCRLQVKDDTPFESLASAPLTSELAFLENPPWILKWHQADQFKVSSVHLFLSVQKQNCTYFFWVRISNIIPYFQVSLLTSFWTPLGFPLLLGPTGWNSSRSQARLSKRYRSGTTLSVSHTTSGTSQSSSHPTRLSFCGLQDMIRMVTYSSESLAFLSPVLYQVRDVYWWPH